MRFISRGVPLARVIETASPALAVNPAFCLSKLACPVVVTSPLLLMRSASL